MKFKLTSKITLWVEDLEIEGTDICDAIEKLTADGGTLGRAICNDEATVYDIAVADNYSADLYEKEIDVDISLIEWTGVPADKVGQLPTKVSLADVSVDNYQVHNGHWYQKPVDRASQTICIKEALLQYIANTYCILLDEDNVKGFTYEITNEQ